MGKSIKGKELGKVLQKIMGHSTLQMTMDLYCHIREDKIKDEMAKIAEFM